jgi:hypothetical protein
MKYTYILLFSTLFSITINAMDFSDSSEPNIVPLNSFKNFTVFRDIPANKNTYFIFDIDETLYINRHGSYPSTSVEKEIPALIKELQDLGFTVIGLTRCGSSPLADLASEEDWLHQELLANKIDLSIHNDKFIIFNKNAEIKGPPIVFSKGIIYAGDRDKGRVFSLFLDGLAPEDLPTIVYMFEDQDFNLEDVAEALEMRGISFFGYEYKYAKNTRRKTLEEAHEAIFQERYKDFSLKDIWAERAKQYLAAIRAKPLLPFLVYKGAFKSCARAADYNGAKECYLSYRANKGANLEIRPLIDAASDFYEQGFFEDALNGYKLVIDLEPNLSHVIYFNASNAAAKADMDEEIKPILKQYILTVDKVINPKNFTIPKDYIEYLLDDVFNDQEDDAECIEWLKKKIL